MRLMRATYTHQDDNRFKNPIVGMSEIVRMARILAVVHLLMGSSRFVRTEVAIAGRSQFLIAVEVAAAGE